MVAAKNIKNVMVSNLGDEDNEELSDLFVDPITGEVQSPEAIVSGDEEDDPATQMLNMSEDELSEIDEPTGVTEAIESAQAPGTNTDFNALDAASNNDVSGVFEAADLTAAPEDEMAAPDATTMVGDIESIMGGDTEPPPLPGIPDVDTKAPEILSADQMDASDGEVPVQDGSSSPELTVDEEPPTAILASQEETFVTEEDLDNAKRQMDEDAAAVDGFLETAVLASDTMLEDEDSTDSEARKGSTLDTSAAFFQVSLRSVRGEKTLARILRIVEKEQLSDDLDSVKKRLEELGGYRFSHLREFQAAILMQELQQLDVECRLDLPAFDGDSDFPSRMESFLSSSDAETKSTGAIAVDLPKNSKEILLSTVDTIAGHEILEEKGIISAHSSVARTFFRSEEQSARLEQKIDHLQPNSPNGKELRLPRAEMDNVFERLLKRIQREAMRRGANAVIGIQISGFPEANAIDPEADQIRLIASGTAVILRGNSIEEN